MPQKVNASRGRHHLFWRKKRVLVTGGAGFLGSFVVQNLKAYGSAEITVPSHQHYDLRDARQIEQLLKLSKPSFIIHLAAHVGGIGANQASPGAFFYDNALMGIQLMEAARRHRIQKFVQLGTVCAYPKHTPVPFKEKNLWDGYPEETNAPYGLAKKMLLVQAQAYRRQYGFNAIYLLPANLYGPRDHIDLANSHVIPVMIRKFIEARERKRPHVTLWGSGRASRDFLYVEDAAEGVLMAAESYNKEEPCNLGTGVNITIKKLAEEIRLQTRYSGRIVWDRSKPDGQPARRLDTTRAAKEFNFKASTPLHEGLRKTVAWVEEKLSTHS